MTNLTDKWKKDELPEGFYYCKLDNNGKDVIAPFYLSKTMIGKQFVKEVLAEMPSYELWKAVHEQRNVLFVENTKLKELLKECKGYFEAYKRGEKCVEQRGEFYNIWELALKGIDQVLGEE